MWRKTGVSSPRKKIKNLSGQASCGTIAGLQGSCGSGIMRNWVSVMPDIGPGRSIRAPSWRLLRSDELSIVRICCDACDSV